MAGPRTNPFDNAFEMLGSPPQANTDSVNEEALEALTHALLQRSADRGRMILLRSPRAGFGKTHLLIRLYQRVAHAHEFISLEPTKGKYLDASNVLDAVLRRFSRIIPNGGGMTVLDLLARRLFATALEPLVRSGDVPSQDRNSAVQALQNRPVETFDFHNEGAVTATWAKANFSQLGPRLTSELAERIGAGFRPVAWWVELLFRYSSAELEQNSRNSALFETVFGESAVETDVHEKLVTLLNLTGLVTSPVLVLDEVEGFSSNPEAALQVATFLNALHQSCSRLALIISVNGDVWETAFLPRLPCGLKDRLSDIVIDLKPMENDVAEAMIRDRAGDEADEIIRELDFDTGVVYARGLVREASAIWERLDGERQELQKSRSVEPISLEQPIADVVATPDTTSETEPTGNEPQQPVDVAPAAGVVSPFDAASQAPQPDQSEVLQSPSQPDSVQTPSQTPSQTHTEEELIETLNNPLLEALVEESSSPDAKEGTLPETIAQEPQVPAEQPIPDPFGTRQESSQADPGQPLAEQPPAPQTVEQQTPANVINSPFSIDTAANPPSPFQPPVEETPTASEQAPAASPFQVDPNQPPHKVTEQDHDKVEDLLKQFRDRYGRDD